MYRKVMISGKWKQYYYGTIASLSYTICGSAYVWVNPIIELLNSENSPVPMTPYLSSWVVAVPELGLLISPILSSFLADAFGRRTVLLATALLHMMTWMTIFFTHNVYVVCAVRFFQGSLLGTVSTVLPMYLGEICDAARRGRILVFYTIGWNTGLLLEFLAGPFIDYYNLLWFNMAIPAIFLLMFFFSYETPYFYMLHGNKEEAGRSLLTYRDEGTMADDELAAIEKSIGREIITDNKLGDLLGTRKGRRALIITVITGLCYYGSGSSTVVSYSDDSFHKITKSESLASYFTIAMGIILVFSPFFSLLTIDRWGRKRLLIFSYLGSVIFLTPAIVNFVLTDYMKIENKVLEIVTVTCLSLQIPIINCGVMPVLHLYQAELFTTTTRSLASGIVIFTGAVASIATMLPYYSLENEGLNIANYGLYAAFSFFGLVYTITYIPETKGMTFDQIQAIL